MKKAVNVTVTVLFLALIFGLGVAFWIIPDSAISIEENRSDLQLFPSVTLKTWLDGSVNKELTDYYSEQFPLRSAWVKLHGLGELALGRGESSGVLLGKDGQLATRRFDAYVTHKITWSGTDYFSKSHVKRGTDALVELEQQLDAPLTVLLPPRTVDVMAGSLGYPAELSDELVEAVQTALTDGGVQSLDLLDTFRKLHDDGQYVYYRTDHHWTTRGAYVAYAALMKDWGLESEAMPEEAFTVRQIEDFYGRIYFKSGMFFVSPDTLEIWETADDDRYSVTAADGSVILESGFINESYLDEQDKYSAFLDTANHSIRIIKDKQATEPRPRLLVAHDSFANCLVPFLARHFDIVMVNLTKTPAEVSALAAEYQCDRVLVLCNYEYLVTSATVAAIG